jgi:hypothetical protein
MDENILPCFPLTIDARKHFVTELSYAWLYFALRLPAAGRS